MPDIFDPEAVEEAEQGLLFLFLNNAKRLATVSGKNGIWSGAYAGPTGGKELVVTFLETGAPAEDGRKIRALVRIFSPALQGLKIRPNTGMSGLGKNIGCIKRKEKEMLMSSRLIKSILFFLVRGWRSFI